MGANRDRGLCLARGLPIPLACAGLHNHRPRPLARAAPPAVGSRVPARLPPPPPAPTRREQAALLPARALAVLQPAANGIQEDEERVLKR